MSNSDSDPLELPQRLLDDGRAPEARTTARTALDALSASADPLVVGALQLVELRAALDFEPGSLELARLCRDALNNVRGDTDKEEHARLCQLRIALDLQDAASARDALAWLREPRRKLTAEHLAQLIMIEAQFAPSPAAKIEHMRRGIGRLPHGPEQLEMRLFLAQMQLHHRQPTELLDGLVEAAIGEARKPRVASMLESLAWNHHDRLSPASIDSIIDWARERAPHVSGFLLAQIGRVDEAIALLTRATAIASEFVRARCLHTALPFLPNGPERRSCVDELEVLLDRNDDPASRHDLVLAQAQLASTERDIELMERALANARRVAPELPGVGNELLGGVLGELVRLRAATPTAQLAELGAELLRTALLVSPLKSSPVQLSVAAAMTMMGPLCHQDVIGSAVALMALADSSETSERIEARCVWLVRHQKGQLAEPGNWPKGPFDDAPRWLIDLCLGVDRQVTPDELRVGHQLLPHAVSARPDVADHLLAALIPAWEAASGPWVAELEDSIAESVERPIYGTPDAWPKLRAAIEDARTRSSRAWLHGLAATIARGRGEAPPEAGAVTQAASTREQVRLLFNRARQASEYVRQLRRPESERETNNARALYREALAAAERARDVEMMFHIRVGLGNALRWGTNADIEAALEQYRTASALNVDQPDALAKLWKVWGDALFERGGDDDLREAYRLIARSIEHRSGRLRAESLISAEQVAQVHPDFNEETRLRRSIQHMQDAVRVGPEIAAEIVPVLCRRIAELRRLCPRNHGTDLVLDELQQRQHRHSADIERARQGVGESFDPRSQQAIMHMMTDPDCRVVGELLSRLSDVESRLAQTLPQILQTLSIDRLRAVYEASSIRDSPARLQAELERLETETREGATGRLVARLLVIAQLVRLGQHNESLARQTTVEARRAIGQHPDHRTRALLGMTLAETWQAHDTHNTQPMCDVDLSREIAADAVETVGGVEQAIPDLVVLLARGHRYARTGDRNEHLRRARDLYSGLHARALAAGDGDTAAVALNHHVEVDLEMAYGDRRTRLRDGITKLEYALTLAMLPVRVAEIEIAIAWYTTQLADFIGGDEQRMLLEQAMARFDAVDRNAAPSAASLEHLRSVCQGSLERVRRGPEAEVQHWESQLADPSLPAYDRAVAQHNLAIILRRLPRLDSSHILRALVLFDEAARVREPASGRHAWETCYEAGLMVVQALKSEQGLAPELLPWERPVAILQARSWLERALRAATQLGPGEELVDVAIMLGRLAFEERSFDATAELAERSWTALRSAAPYLLFRDDLRAWEAKLCRQVAARLAGLALDVGIVGVGDNDVRAINAEASELAIRWLLRGQASVGRPTLARIQRPQTATVPWWSRWQATLDRRDHRELARLLEQIHAIEPEYLTGEPSLDQTWAWLEAEPEAIALAVLLEQDIAICAVLYLDEHGARQARVLVMPSHAPTTNEEHLVGLIKEAIVGDPAALRLHALLVKWARDSIVNPTLQYLGRAPKTVLWCPGPILRLATPSSVWSGVPVACVHTLVLPRYRQPKQRPRSTLIAGAMQARDSIAPKLEPAVKAMLNEAKRSGPARALVSAGDVFGDRLRQLKPIRNTPASPEDFLAEAPNHDRLFVLAHGAAGSEDQAALACIDADGKRVLLTGKHLAAHHDAFADATVVLLACSSGRIGGELHTPDGVAGALLAAGARAVIAPLWSVHLSIAIRVARGLLSGFAKQQAPWQVLAQLPAHVFEPGPALDEPSAEDKRAGGVVQVQSFIVWLG